MANGKWQMGNGKWQIKGLRRNYISFAGSDKLNKTKNYPRRLPLFEERGTTLAFLFIKQIFKRAYNQLFRFSLSGGGEFSTRQRSVVESQDSNVTKLVA